MKRIVFFFICFGLVPAVLASDSKNKSSMEHLDIRVRDITGLKSLRPVTGGVPLPEGAAPDGTHFALFDENSKPVPCQSSILARWNDGSVRWVLLDFQAEPPANGMAYFKLGDLPNAARWVMDGLANFPNDIDLHHDITVLCHAVENDVLTMKYGERFEQLLDHRKEQPHSQGGRAVLLSDDAHVERIGRYVEQAKERMAV